MRLSLVQCTSSWKVLLVIWNNQVMYAFIHVNKIWCFLFVRVPLLLAMQVSFCFFNVISIQLLLLITWPKYVFIFIQCVLLLYLNVTLFHYNLVPLWMETFLKLHFGHATLRLAMKCKQTGLWTHCWWTECEVKTSMVAAMQVGIHTVFKSSGFLTLGRKTKSTVCSRLHFFKISPSSKWQSISFWANCVALYWKLYSDINSVCISRRPSLTSPKKWNLNILHCKQFAIHKKHLQSLRRFTISSCWN